MDDREDGTTNCKKTNFFSIESFDGRLLVYDSQFWSFDSQN